MKIKNKAVTILNVSISAFIILGCSGNYNDIQENYTATPLSTATPIPPTSTPEPQSVSITPTQFDGYLTNPGMGWQWDGSSTSKYFPETVAYGNRIDISWLYLNPNENEYNWQPLDDKLAEAVADGKQFSFRVYTMAGETYGGHQLPQWVIDKGATILTSDEPDYSNCIYQEEWGKFVTTLLERYDGNPNIAFIDISGYGDFNEWSWVDQTEWDDYFDPAFASASLTTLDGQARRRLADMFIGGTYEKHQCRDENGQIQTVRYDYTGAQETQLIMPNAGVIQSTQYVFAKRKDVGYRFDCLGRDTDLPYEEISQIWLEAPVIFEFCGPDGFDPAIAYETIKKTHPILIHNNDYSNTLEELQKMITFVGYRFFLKEANSDYAVNAGGDLTLNMTWQNLGTAPTYPKLGQDFELHVYLLNITDNTVVFDSVVGTDISQWLPATNWSVSEAPEYQISPIISIPSTIPKGVYLAALSIIDKRTGLPIQLAMDGEFLDGKFPLFNIGVK